MGKKSSVDESLFGFKQNHKAERAKTAPVTTRTVVTASDLERIKQAAMIKTEAEKREEYERFKRMQEERDKISTERKNKIRELDRKAHLNIRKSDSEIANQARDDMIKKLATQKLDEDNDMVKCLTSYAARAQAFTIRDAQLRDKEERLREEKEYERRMDMAMEIDRIKDLQRRTVEEEERKAKRFEDRKVIVEQMEYRQKAKLLALEAKEQENMRMRQIAAKYVEEDVEAARKRHIHLVKAQKEILLANDDAIQRKKDARDLEKREVEEIIIYQKLKDAEMLKREQEEAVLERSKKETQAKLLAQQEKLLDNADKLDEIRARRATEEYERRERKKEREEALKRKADAEELLKARAIQAAAKKAAQEEEAIIRKKDFEDALQYANAMHKREVEERNSNVVKARMHREGLLKQISDNDDRRRMEKSKETDDGSDYKQYLVAEEARLTVLRDKMISDMEQKGVNPKYLGEMKGVDIKKIIQR